MWDAHTGECLRAISDHKRAAYTLTFSPEGKFLATASGDGWIYVYRVPVSKLLGFLFFVRLKYRIGWRAYMGLVQRLRKDGHLRDLLATSGRFEEDRALSRKQKCCHH